MGRARLIFLDTCTLLWWALAPEQLSKKADLLIKTNAKSGNILVSSISIWEIAIKCKKNKLDLGLSVDEFTSKLRKSSSLQILAVDENIWLASVNLEWSHRDHVDRIIVSHAKELNLPLLTSDKAILEFYDKAVWD